MQAITTKFHGPTNHRGSRITARCQACRLTVPYNHALGLQANHREAAAALARKLEWTGKWSGGSLPDGGGVFVCESFDEFTGTAES